MPTSATCYATTLVCLLSTFFGSSCSGLCSPQDGACLALYLEGSGHYDLVSLHMISTAANEPMAVSTQIIRPGSGDLPVTLRVPPPPNISVSAISSISALTIDSETNLQRTMGAALSWTDGANIEQTLIPALLFERHDLPTIGADSDVAIGDLNNDGLPDLVVAHTENQISIFFQRPDHNFDLMGTPFVHIGPSSVQIVDLNGDGFADILVSANTDVATVLYGSQGGQRFTAADLVLGANSKAILAADFDADGQLDVAAGGAIMNGVIVARLVAKQAVSTSVQLKGSAQSVPVQGGALAGITAADVDGDGDLDLVVTMDQSAPMVNFLINTGGTFAQAAGLNLTAGNQNNSTVATDFDGDGRIDLAVLADESSSLHIFNGKNRPAFTPQQTLKFGLETYSPYYLHGADLNQDGHVDLIVSAAEENALLIMLGQDKGMFAPPIRVAVAEHPRGFAIADLDGDGRLDIAVASYTTVSVLLNRAL